ncbi:NAD-dependent epimerase/dehydratase family protein [Parerythrobacter jejuensis]|uniref:NAD-dependent epimerase/dehydratase family protein n=1 Tax=Parerythrobacter jejuensis TaxID=795812 RepID=A0A845AN08_9SPHN|nr:NAD(P)-dependent oxidoreductase [Parerythrobacter jejuensis]MXP31660.1 NAD-dependent epimerase/dehydratase family protein [Parerythrobacter jejuensis]
MRLAITGGTGFVGQALVDLVETRSIKMRSLARSIPDKRRGVDWVQGDLANTVALAKLVDGVDAVIHIAGQVRARDPQEFEAANVTGTLNVVEAALEAKVPRFVFVSSLAAREPALSRYGASKLRAEKLVAASGLDWTIIRPPAVYGPRDGEMLDLFEMASMGVVPMPKQGHTSLIHVGDLARLLLAVLPSDDDTTSKIFEPDDGRPGGWEHRDLALAIGWAMGKKPFVPRLSRGVLGFAARMDGLLRRDGAKLTPDRVGYMCHPDWVSSPDAKPDAALWVPKIPTRDGLKATAKWYKDRGWV